MQERERIVQGALGPMRVIVPFTSEEVAERTSQGQATPLGLMPSDFWWRKGQSHPRFSEEMLGTDF